MDHIQSKPNKTTIEYHLLVWLALDLTDGTINMSFAAISSLDGIH